MRSTFLQRLRLLLRLSRLRAHRRRHRQVIQAIDTFAYYYE
jgi:hypothetical protein